jgi:hypothetical protein
MEPLTTEVEHNIIIAVCIALMLAMSIVEIRRAARKDRKRQQELRAWREHHRQKAQKGARA